MTDFTEKHENQLADYFAGVFAGRCGLRSSMGGQLAALQAAPDVPKRRPGVEYMLVKRQSHDTERDGGDVSNDMLAAARELREIESVLRTLELDDVIVLRAHYTPRPPRVMSALAALVLGSTLAGEVMLRYGSEDRDERREGKRELASAEHQAKTRLDRARQAYALAEDAARAAAKDARRRRFAACLEARA